MCSNRPGRRSAPDGGGAIRTCDLLLDRVGERREVSLAFLDQKRPVLQSDETRGVALGVGCLGRGDRVVLTLTRNTVDAGLGNCPGEQRRGRSFNETALLGEPLVQRLAPEDPHYPDGSINP